MDYVKIYPVETDEDIEATKKLLVEYAIFLKELLGGYDKSWGELHYQKTLTEADNLLGEYSEPDGYMLLAKYKGVIAGCIAISRKDKTTCELKRVYVKPQYRRKGIGKRLGKAVIEKAAMLNYERICLHANGILTGSKELYISLGFKDMGPIESSPVPESSAYMELKLTQK